MKLFNTRKLTNSRDRANLLFLLYGSISDYSTRRMSFVEAANELGYGITTIFMLNKRFVDSNYNVE